MTAKARAQFKAWTHALDLRVARKVIVELLPKLAEKAPAGPELAWAMTEVEYDAEKKSTPRDAANLSKEQQHE